jgi:hypothetical protein
MGAPYRLLVLQSSEFTGILILIELILTYPLPCPTKKFVVFAEMIRVTIHTEKLIKSGSAPCVLERFKTNDDVKLFIANISITLKFDQRKGEVQALKTPTP